MPQIDPITQTLGFQNLNPLNLRPLDRGEQWHGQVGNSRGFCRFSDVRYCFRAWLIQSRNYFITYAPINTVWDFIKHYAPSADDNDPRVYADNVETYLQIAKDEPINVAFFEDRKLEWCEAQMTIEIGGVPYSVQTILEGFSWVANR